MKHYFVTPAVVVLLGALNLMPLRASQPNDAPPVRNDHGIVLFYTTGIPHEDLIGIKDPNVYGGELILFWHEFEPRDGEFDWSRLEQDLDLWHRAGKKLDIRLSTAHIGPNFTPSWVFRNHGVRRIGRGVFEDFEGDSLRYEMGNDASIVRDDARGGRCLSVEAGSVDGPEPFLLLPADAPLLSGSTYSIQWDQLSTGGGGGTLEVVAPESQVVASTRLEPGDQWATAGWEGALPAEGGPFTVRWIADPGARFRIDNVNIIRVDEVIPFNQADFEDGWDDWLPVGEASSITADRPTAMQGTRSLRASNDREGFSPFLRNNPDRFPLRRGDGVHVRFQAYAEKDARLQLRIVSPRFPKGEIHEVSVDLSGGKAQRVVFYAPDFLPSADCEFQFGLSGPGEVFIDEIEHRNWADVVTVFPDYFSAEFQRLWQRALDDFARRFANHPALGIVSISGIGRWEEVMLDEDVKGILDDQWHARGFSQERYLSLIEHWMDAHQKALPGVDLRICLAYGLEMVNDVDWVYRRVAQAAVRRGIGLKQNGLSEKYDTWNENTNTSYLYHRYRDRDDVSLTHETGGQIYRNLYDAHGYPQSLLNRAQANYADFLFLYTPDIFGRNINRYFHTYAEQMGPRGVGLFHAWLGDYSLVNEHTPKPVAYQNHWMGLRQFNSSGAEPDATIVAGERVLRTNAGNPRIVFDVDDRYQYHGMFGAELSLDYFDYPAGSFHVRVYDNPTDQWRTLGLVERSGSKDFRRAFFYDSSWCRSRRNGGEDIHADVEVEVLSGGELALRNAELAFVPFGDWLLEEVAGSAATNSGVVAEPTLSALLSTSGGESSCALSFFVHAPDPETNHLSARVYVREPGRKGERLLSEKEYYIAADGDEVFLPFTPVIPGSMLRLEVTAIEGSIGWKTSEGKIPAHRIWRFQPDRSELPAPDRLAELGEGDAATGSIELTRPTGALRIWLGTVPPTPTPHEIVGEVQANIRVYRVNPVGTGDALILSLERFPIQENGWLQLPIEPQAPGDLRVEVERHWRELHAAVDSEDALLIEPLYLLPKFKPRAPRPVTTNNVVKTLELDKDQHDVQKIPLKGFDNALEWKGLGLSANPRQRIVMTLQNGSVANLGRVFWATEGEQFSGQRSALIPLVPLDDRVRDYAVPVGFHEEWRGEVDRIKLLPAAGSTRRGFVSIEKVLVDERVTLLDLDFRRPLDFLRDTADVASIERGAEGIAIVASGASPRLQVPAGEFNVWGEEGHVLRLRLRNQSSASTARIGWYTLERDDLNPRRAFESDQGSFIDFPITSEDEEVREYIVDLSSHRDWSGHIVALTLWPMRDVAEGDRVVIESLSIVAGEGE